MTIFFKKLGRKGLLSLSLLAVGVYSKPRWEGGGVALGVWVTDVLLHPSVHYCIGDSGRQHTSPRGNVNTVTKISGF